MSARSRRDAHLRRALPDALTAFYDGDDPTGSQARGLLYAYAASLGRNDLRTQRRIDALLSRAANRVYEPEPFDPEPDYDADLATVVAGLRDGWLGKWDDALAAILAALYALTGSTADALRLLAELQAAINEASAAVSDTPDADPHPPNAQRVHALVDAPRPGPRPVACVQRQPHLI